MAKTIVLADDSPTIHKIVELTFSDTEIRVEGLVDGSGVVDRVADLQADLLLADVALPGGTGYELCRRIKSSSRPIPVLLLGGTFEPLDRDLVQECGADGHLIKPFEPNALRARVEELLAGSGRPGTAARKTARSPTATAPAAAAQMGASSRRVEVESAAGVTAELEANRLSPKLVEAVARAVVERISDRVVREIAREVVPDLAASIIRERIRELEQEDQD